MNKLGTKLGAIAMSAVMALSFAPSAAITSLAADGDDVATTAAVDPGQAIYGLYNPNSGEHLFTANATEAAGLQVAGWQEGDVKWYSPTSGTKVYRLYNPNVFAPDGTPLGDHHYTTDPVEVENLKTAGWSEDAEFFYAQTTPGEGSVPVYKLYNPNAYKQPKYSGAHHFTLDEKEKDDLLNAGWTEGDVAFYTLGKEKPVVAKYIVSIDNTTPNVGDTLRALIYDEDGNEVNPEDVDAEIQWFADGVEISDATAAEYPVLVGDVGVKLSVEVTIGDETYTAETEEVEPAEEPVEELTVTIVSEDEIPTVGELLTAVVTDEDGEVVDAELLHYQWYAGEDAIDESDTAILLVTDEFVGKTLSVEVTDADGNTFKSEPTAEVEAAEVEELTVSIDNTTPKVGDILTAEVVDRNGEDVSDNVTFQWYADDVVIEGADEATLVVDDELLGAALKVVVTAESGNTFESEPTEAVEAKDEYVVLLNNTVPTVGDEIESELVDAEDYTEIIDAEGFEIQWYADGEAIEGADEATLVVDEELVGKVLKVVYTDAEGNEYGSEETAAVEAAAYTVEISDSTPTVGDTLTFTLYDAEGNEVNTDDIDAEIQWFLGDAEIEGETDAELEVTDDMVGSVISVIVTIDDEEYTDETAEVEYGEFAIDAYQSGASEVTVLSSLPLGDTDKITLTRSSKEQDITVSIADDGMSATLTTSTPIGAAEYTVVVTPADEDLDPAEDTFTGETSALEEIRFMSDKLVVTGAGNNTATVAVKGFDQFGKEVTLSSLQAYCSGGTAIYTKADSLVTCTAQGIGGFTLDNPVTVTVVYQNGSTVKQASANLTVSTSAYIDEIEFGDLATTKASLKDAHVTHTNLATDTYYLPVLMAQDQYGNDLTKKQLNDMITNKVLYITPSANTGAYAYANGFEELEDGTIILKIGNGALTLPGTQTINILSVGGVQTQAYVDVEDERYIAGLDVSMPEIYSGTDAEVTVSAVDQYGESFTAAELYNFGLTQTDTKTLTFGDLNSLTTSQSSIAVNNGTLTVTKNAQKKTLTIKYTPVAGLAADATDVMTINTAKPSVNTITLTVFAQGHPAGIKGLKSGLDTVLGPKNTTVDLATAGNVVFTDTYGSTVATTNAENPVYDADRAGQTIGTYYYNVAKKVPASSNTVFTPGTGAITAGTTSGEDTYTITLYKSNNATTDTSEALATKDVKITNAENTYKSYTAEVASGDELLYIGAKTYKQTGGGADSAKIKVYGIDASGNKTELTATEVTLAATDDLVCTGLTVTAPTTPKNITNGEVEGTATISVIVNGIEETTVSLEYSNADQVATSTLINKGTSNAAGTTFTAGSKSSDTSFTAATNATPIIAMDEDGWQVLSVDNTNGGVAYGCAILDQYGCVMLNQTVLASDSAGTTDEAGDGETATLTYDANEFTTVFVKCGSQTITFTINGAKTPNFS